MREALVGCLALAALAAPACRAEVPSVEGEPVGAEDEGRGGSPPTAGRSSDGSGSAEPGSSDDTEPVAMAAGGEATTPRGADADCGGEPVTLEEIHSGRVRSGVRVAVEPLVANSQKFLVSEAKSGSCLWGAMAAHSSRVGAGSGLFVVSFGARHAEGAACQPGTDGLPDDLAPGDELDVEGTLDEFVPAACDGVAPALQLRVDPQCAARRGGRVDAPASALLDAATADAIATGRSAELLRGWAGALVRLEGVSATRDDDDGDAVLPFGVMRLEQTSLELHSRIYYFDLSGGGPRSPEKAPRFTYPASFASVSGHVFLDYCTWALGPRSTCSDFSPPGPGCAK